MDSYTVIFFFILFCLIFITTQIIANLEPFIYQLPHQLVIWVGEKKKSVICDWTSKEMFLSVNASFKPLFMK